MRNFILFSGSSNVPLAESVAQILEVSLGACTLERFPDGELDVRLDEPVRGREVFVLQSTSPPVNDHLVELLALADACRRAAARRVTVILPYFGYARADKRHGQRQPITASMVAAILQTVGVEHVVTIDLHAPQIEGFFHVPVDMLTAVPILCEALRHRLPPRSLVVSPDEGRVKMAAEYARLLGSSVIVLHKQRGSGGAASVTRVVGEVRDRPCLIIDDMITTGGTIAQSVAALLEHGARPEITVAATHGVLVGKARENLSHPAIRQVLVSDTVAIAPRVWPQLQIVSVAPLLAAAIQRLQADESISDLFPSGSQADK